MKTFFLLLYGVIAVTGCADNKTPKATVSEFLQLIDKFEFEKANDLLLQNPENTAAMTNIKTQASSFSKERKEELIVKAKNRIYNIEEKETSGDKAIIVATNNEGHLHQ